MMDGNVMNLPALEGEEHLLTVELSGLNDELGLRKSRITMRGLLIRPAPECASRIGQEACAGH